MSRILRLTDRNAEVRSNCLSAEPLTREGRSYPLKVNFPAGNKAEPKTERVTGEDAEQANAFLTRRYRAPFVVPERV
jgi:hypothetical protein